MELYVVTYKINTPCVGVDLFKNFCNNKGPHHLGSALFTEAFFFAF